MSDFTPWDGKGIPQDVADNVPLIVQYRGPANPAFGERITCSWFGRFGWSHDGGNDDIIGYKIAEFYTGDK